MNRIDFWIQATTIIVAWIYPQPGKMPGFSYGHALSSSLNRLYSAHLKMMFDQHHNLVVDKTTRSIRGVNR